jgi:hypothetical protein
METTPLVELSLTSDRLLATAAYQLELAEKVALKGRTEMAEYHLGIVDLLVESSQTWREAENQVGVQLEEVA